jgi:hypothetical protein
VRCLLRPRPGTGNTWYFFDDPTPGAPNTTTPYPEFLAPVTFSHPGGFHPASFNLTLSHPDPDAVIIYTLDGSTPDINNLGGTTYQYKNNWPHRVGDPFGAFLQQSFTSRSYDGPIPVINRSGQPDKLTQISSTWHRTPNYFPNSPVYKGTVVQARAFKPGALPSYFSGHTYFIDPAGNPFQHPIVSLQIQEDLLFDYHKGLYTAGADFDAWRAANPSTNAGGTEHWAAPYNWQRGSGYQLAGTEPRESADWEYPGRMEFFEPDGTTAAINQGMGFRVHGNASRGLRSKSLRLYARNRYDFSNEFEHRVFPWDVPFATNPDNDVFKRIMMRGPGSGGPYMNEWTVHKLMEGSYEGVTRIRNVVQFINGEYWGLTAVRDRFDRHHFANHFNLDPDNVVVTTSRGWNESHGINDGFPSDLDDFNAMRTFISNNNMADDTLYRQAEDLLCMRSYIDHVILNVHFNNTHFETAFWRARLPSDTTFGDGRWRVTTQDFEYIFGTGNYLDTAYNNLPIFRSLLNNPEFRHRFINRFADLINTTLAPARVESLVTQEYAALAPDLAAHQHRWGIDYFLGAYPWEPTDSRHNRSLNDMIGYANAQPDTQRARLRTRFGLPSDADVTVNLADPARGHVRINSLDLREGTPGVPANPYPWTGTYFAGTPVSLEAIPKDGYRFSHWVVDGSSAGGQLAMRHDLTQGQYEVGLAGTAQSPFTDESITITSLPSQLDGRVILKTANAESAWSSTGPATTVTNIQWTYTDAIPDRSPTGDSLPGANTTLADGSGLFQPIVGNASGGNYWDVRTDVGNGGSILQSFGGTTDGPLHTRELKTTIRNLQPGQSYPVSAVFWRSGNPWTVRAGLSYGNDTRANTLYDMTDAAVYRADGLQWTNSVLMTESNRILMSAFLGHATAAPDGSLDVFVHDMPAADSNRRTWYDGVAVGSAPLASGGPYLAFEPARDTTVYIVNHPSHVPVWLSTDYTATGLTVQTSAGTFDVWEKPVSAGELVTLPGHGGQPSDLNYWVVLGDDPEDDTYSTLASISLPLTEDTQVTAVFEPLTIIHRWDFENSTTFLQPSQTVGGGASLQVTPGPTTQILRNTTAQDFPTAHLRVNNPIGATVTWNLPTTQFGNLVLTWQTRRSGQGAGTQTLETTTDGTTWNPLATYTVEDAAPQEKSFDLASLLPAAADNPLFAVRVTFSQGLGGIEGNNRFDNVTLSGVPVPGGKPPATIAFDSIPVGTTSGGTILPVVIRLRDIDGLTASSFNGPVTLSLLGPGTLTGTLTVNAVNGIATFDNLVLTGTGAYQLVASAAALDPATSPTIRSLTLAGLMVPRLIQGGQDALGENNDRVPFAWNARIDGLAPHATYRFANRVVLPGDTPTSDGAGNMIFVTSAHENWIRTTDSPRFLIGDLGTRHHTFTSDGAGSYTGWFITEPTGNARFTPGNTVQLRLLLNDGADGEETAHILTTTESAQVIRFGTAAGEGTAIIGQAASAARRIAVLYDETAGTSRPLAATPVEITGAGVDSRYAAFYQDIVAPNQSHWGTILPNTLPNGLRRIEIRTTSNSADILDTRIAASGFPGTVNPSGSLGSPIPLDPALGIPTAFAQWRDLHFADPAQLANDAISGPNASPSGDGIDNLIRYAHNAGPHDPVQHLLPRLAPATGGGFDYRFRPDPTKPDLIWIIRASTNLQNWPGLVFDSRTDTPPPADPQGWSSLQVPATDPRAFYQLEITVTP